MVVAPPPPAPAAIVRAWSAALNANHNAAAAKLFAPNARIVQGPLDVRLTTPQLAIAFNASLPCAGTITRITVNGDRATATFVLGHRPRHTCNAARGEKAAALFVVRDGKIVLWEQVAVPKSAGGVPA
jgi:limonene-1,2-epoxide hydrolase